MDILADNSINMVISDWEMPVMDGLKTLFHYPKKTTLTGIFILVLITVRQSVEDLITGLDVGADDFLSKPINQKVSCVPGCMQVKRILKLEATLDARNQKVVRKAYQQIEADLTGSS
ncbi:response regulator [Budvicia aquatica]|uniref:Phosphate regulon transcriptional regulatory protein phoB n=1 Tax=Budvicia aquatica TaxID=82979 RepID=A0A484ZFM2_9GAMM|nr:response regulator [Budvicia aquatica]VFS46898.1 Phosphate regulon transcriptional regulatory protein phoB [Budvicia aquatica]